MVDLICKSCGGEREKGRRICHDCYKKEAKERSKKRFENGIRTRYTIECAVCNKSYTTTHKNSRICRSCYLNSKRKLKSSSSYIFVEEHTYLHRKLVEDILLRKLNCNEVVHHLDGDTKNNSLRNIVIISNSDHSKLHRYLELELPILNKNNNLTENSIKFYKRSLSLSYIFDNNIEVIKMWEVENDFNISDKNYLKIPKIKKEDTVCSCCGKVIDKRSASHLCMYCYKRHKENNNITTCISCNKSIDKNKTGYCLICLNKIKAKNIPPREELLPLIGNVSMVKIGLKYNVSDNTVKKWCKKYEIWTGARAVKGDGL